MDNTRRKARLDEALTPPRISHPIVSAVQFAHLTRTEGGATMNVHTNKIAEPGDSVYFVGGERDRHGERIPTAYEGDLSPADVIRHKNRLKAAAGNNPVMNLGSWQEAGKTEVDASGGYADLATAMDHMRARNEKALWNMKSMEEVRNKDYRP